jgi:hypothetical protein
MWVFLAPPPLRYDVTNIMRRFFLLATALCLALAAAAQNAAKPNFTGVWNMDLEKSNFGGIAPPASAQYLIRQTGNTVMLQYTQDNHTSRVDIVPDGADHLTETVADSQTWTRSYWSGKALVIESRSKPLPSSNRPVIQWTSRWTLSPDRKRLTIHRRISAPDSDPIEQTVVFAREK